jgi:hypothetical protein
MSDERADWPPQDWQGELRVGIQMRNPGTHRWTTYFTTYMEDATREDYERLQTALQRLAREHGMRHPALEEEPEPEPGHPGPGTGHS